MQLPRHLCPQPCKSLPSCERSFLFLSRWEKSSWAWYGGKDTKCRNTVCIISPRSCLVMLALLFLVSLPQDVSLTQRARVRICQCKAFHRPFSKAGVSRSHCSAGITRNVSSSFSRCTGWCCLGAQTCLTWGIPARKCGDRYIGWFYKASDCTQPQFLLTPISVPAPLGGLSSQTEGCDPSAFKYTKSMFKRKAFFKEFG